MPSEAPPSMGRISLTFFTPYPFSCLSTDWLVNQTRAWTFSCICKLFPCHVSIRLWLSVVLCYVSGRSCVRSSGRLRCCRSNIPRSAWKTPTWPRRWRPRGRPSGSVRERTRSSTHTTRCRHTPVNKYLLRAIVCMNTLCLAVLLNSAFLWHL